MSTPNIRLVFVSKIQGIDTLGEISSGINGFESSCYLYVPKWFLKDYL